ncbi:MAG: PKD domain-containing protein, partial [Candidatus Firestonebacteria bacterium]
MFCLLLPGLQVFSQTITNPYYTDPLWKLWDTDATPLTDVNLIAPGQIGSLTVVPAGSRKYPYDGAGSPGQYLFYKTGATPYAGSWDDVYFSLDSNMPSSNTPHSYISTTYYGPNYQTNGNSTTADLITGYFASTGGAVTTTDIKKFGVNYTSQSTTGMASDIANTGSLSLEQNYFFSNCLRAGPVHTYYRDDDAIYMNDQFKAYWPVFFNSMSSSGSEIGALTKLVLVGGSLPTAVKKEIKRNGYFIPTLLYIWRASLPYDVPYENELKQDIAYCSFGNGSIQGVNSANYDFHYYDEYSHLKNMIQMAKGMTVPPALTLIKQNSVTGGSVNYFMKTGALITQTTGSDTVVDVSLADSDAYTLTGSAIVSIKATLLYGNPATTIVNTSGRNYLITVPWDANLPIGRTTVIFVAYNAAGGSNPAAVNIYKGTGNINKRPIIANASNQTVFPGDTLTFNVNCTDPDGYPTYIYKRTDQPGTITNKAYSWATTSGTVCSSYPLTLFASDGTTGVNSKVITVVVTNTKAIITADTTSGAAPLTVHFSSLGSCDKNGGGISYLWNFDDGTTSTAGNPIHKYSTPGFYKARLTVTGTLGSHTASVVIEVKPDPWKLDLNNGWTASGLDPSVWSVIDPSKGSTSIVSASGEVSLKLNVTTAPFGIQSVKSYDLPYYAEVDFKNTYGQMGDGFTFAGSRIGWDLYTANASPATITNLGSTGLSNIGQTVESAQNGAERLTLKVKVEADPNNPGKARYKGTLTSQLGVYNIEFENQTYTPGTIKITEGSAGQDIYRFQVWVKIPALPPTISGISPASGDSGVPNTISIAGTGFFGEKKANDVQAVKLYSLPVTELYDFSVDSDAAISNVVIPAGIDPGSYLVKVSNTTGESTDSVYYTVTDATPPELTGLTGYDTALSVQFSEKLNGPDAANKANYAIYDGATLIDISPSTVTLQYSKKQTIITGYAFVVGHTLAVTVTGVKDLAGNAINVAKNSLTTTVGARVVSSLKVEAPKAVLANSRFNLTVSALLGSGAEASSYADQVTFGNSDSAAAPVSDYVFTGASKATVINVKMMSLGKHTI